MLTLTFDDEGKLTKIIGRTTAGEWQNHFKELKRVINDE